VICVIAVYKKLISNTLSARGLQELKVKSEKSVVKYSHTLAGAAYPQAAARLGLRPLAQAAPQPSAASGRRPPAQPGAALAAGAVRPDPQPGAAPN